MIRRSAARSSLWPVAGVLAVLAAGPAAAACREELVTAAKGLETSRAGVAAAAKGAAPAKCAADRQHLAALRQVRDVFGRCDKSAAKAKNLGQVDGSIAVTARNVEHSCKR